MSKSAHSQELDPNSSSPPRCNQVSYMTRDPNNYGGLRVESSIFTILSLEGKIRDTKKWMKMSILSAAGSGKFSSDRTISEYAKAIWKIQECRVP